MRVLTREREKEQYRERKNGRNERAKKVKWEKAIVISQRE